MANERRSKKKSLRRAIRHYKFRSTKKQKQKLVPSTITISAKINNIATKTLLDDKQNGFNKGNFVCSPLSLEFILRMVAAGAKGETLNQLLEFLGLESTDQLHLETPSSKLFSQILSNPKGGEDDLHVSLANGAWLDKSLKPVLPSYNEVLRTVYKTKAKYVDFINMPNRAACKVNSWVNKKTKGLIPNIVETSAFNDKDVAMVFANALYFKGSWSTPFYENKTTEQDFHLINGETVSVPFMTSNHKFMYGSFEGLKIIKIGYQSDQKSNKFFMYIFLPDKKDGLQNLLEKFHSGPGLFHESFDLVEVKFDKLWVPKFKISYKFEAQDVMKQMGLTLPFERSNKELTGIVDSPLGDMLYVSKIVQKSFIEVNETGTKAAACSLSMSHRVCPRRMVKPPPPPSFVADHPFMFMIREDTSRAVFFIGVVLNPKIDSFLYP